MNPGASKIILILSELIGFGISKPEHIEQFKDVCDRVIVGSAVIKSLIEEDDINSTNYLIENLSIACTL